MFQMHSRKDDKNMTVAVEVVPGVASAQASASHNTLTVKGPAKEDDLRSAVEKAGYTYKGIRSK